MSHIKTLIAMACTVACASFLLLGGGMERVGQVGLAVYAALMLVLMILSAFVKDMGPESPMPIKILGRGSYLYVVAASAFTGHMIIAFVLAISWVLGWFFRSVRKAEAEKAGAARNDL